MRSYPDIKLFIFFIYLAAAAQLYLAYHSLGGIDVGRYWNYSYSADLTQPYYFKEVVSWGIIKVASTYFGREHFLFAIAIAIFLMGGALIGLQRSIVLYASFLSPFGILLEFNVLRQCLGVVFVATALAYILRGRMVWFVGCSIAAVLSHNSSVIILGFVGAAYIYKNMPSSYRPLVVIISFFTIISMQLLGILDHIIGEKAYSLFTNIEDGPENIVYAITSISYSIALYIIDKSKKYIVIGMCASLMVFMVIYYIFDLESWVYGRMALSNIVVSTFLIFDFHLMNKNPKNIQSVVCYAVLAANCLLIFAHPGAMSMIG